MILTPISPQALPQILDTYDAGLAAHPMAQAVFRRIAKTRHQCPDLKADLIVGCEKAIALAVKLGIPIIDEDPVMAFSWDGHAIRARSETSVIFHEIAHWQVAPVTRRHICDFGLGAGPETGRIAAANAAVCVDEAVQQHEESLASLLGILWEVEYDEPAILAFAEQNWLELYDRLGTHMYFVKSVDALGSRRLINAEGRPCVVPFFSSSP